MSMLPNTVLKGRELHCTTSRTQVQFAAEADINVIVNRFLHTGQLPAGRPEPVFGDISHIPVGTEALAAVRRAQLLWEQLPKPLQDEVGHWTKFGDFLQSEAGQLFVKELKAEPKPSTPVPDQKDAAAPPAKKEEPSEKAA